MLFRNLKNNIRAAAEAVLADFVLPLPSTSNSKADVDDAAWTDRLLTVMKFLDERAISAFLAISGIKAPCVPSSRGFVGFVMYG